MGKCQKTHNFAGFVLIMFGVFCGIVVHKAYLINKSQNQPVESYTPRQVRLNEMVHELTGEPVYFLTIEGDTVLIGTVKKVFIEEEIWPPRIEIVLVDSSVLMRLSGTPVSIRIGDNFFGLGMSPNVMWTREEDLISVIYEFPDGSIAYMR